MTLGKAVAGAIAFFCLMIFLMLFYAWALQVIEINTRVNIASPEIKQKMVYHGTDMSFEINGKHYFYNKKGQRCRL
jgi:hypothetical protein